MNNLATRSSIVFRVDASLAIGSGHVMRCLALAEALHEALMVCVFVCRRVAGNLIDEIERRGFPVHAIASGGESSRAAGNGLIDDIPGPPHRAWLAGDANQDALETQNVVTNYDAKWLVVDHYALDFGWERQARGNTRCQVLAIDDLADRKHDVDLLLDQNLGRCRSDYKHLLGRDVTVLAGPQYALLRPEFAHNRPDSLARHRKGRCASTVLVSLGGIDRDNATEEILKSLESVSAERIEDVTVVMGSNAPWIDAIRERASRSRHTVRVVVNVGDMAERLSRTDVVFGAPGSSAWERCCLGVPSILITLAENQVKGARELSAHGAAISLGGAENISSSLSNALHSLQEDQELEHMSTAAARITDGRGTERVVQEILSRSV